MAGTLRIGSVTSAFDRLLLEVLERFRNDWPDVELQVSEIDTHHGRDRLLRRELDVAIIRQSGSGRGLSSVPLRRDRFVIALPASHPLAGEQGAVDLARRVDLVELSLVSRAGEPEPITRHFIDCAQQTALGD
ncbi:LysR substrate-binding domain-containing protein [Arthrobacter sp. CJ23]|uniref:LysR substrate-binding domain-containing protein n=1 Tax=Arthrobacter sp. CJ23 TaxID=2972479 RepID=UPI00215B8DA1|nr:LysR substrate-binding domain-containing protein [Arthrobacter sp. CJ23]UVJ38967.1 LysR substrate-binding domain-containing protein [Arthrobacter sp. CJ23]